MSLTLQTSANPTATQRGTLTREHALWFGILAFVVVSRLCNLTAAPLNHTEATTALGALALVRGETAVIVNPLFASLQALLFSVFGANDTTARIPSAIAGITLCALPFLLRQSLGHGRALWMAFLLAMSPTLWYVAHQSDGANVAWLLAFTAFCAWRLGAQWVVALCVGLLLASGQDGITPLLVLLLARLADTVVTLDGRRAGIVIALSLCLGATGLLFRPAGLGDVFSGIAAWATQLVTPGQFVVGRLLMGFGLYEPLIYLSAVLSLGFFVIQKFLDSAKQSLRAEAPWLAWFVAGVALLVLTQGRTYENVVPMIIGLAGLASLALQRISQNILREGRYAYEGSVTAIAFVLFALCGIAVRQYAATGDSSWLLLGLIALVFMASLVPGSNVVDSLGMGLRGLACAFGAVLLLHTLSAAVQLNHAKPSNPAEPYVIAPATEELRVLVQTIEAQAMRLHRDKHILGLDVSERAPAALRWALRDQTQLAFKGATSNSESAITSETEKPQGNVAFVGSAFNTSHTANLNSAKCNWAGAKLDCTPLAKWILFREASAPRQERWVFWLRGDLAR